MKTLAMAMMACKPFALSEDFSNITQILSGYMGESICSEEMMNTLRRVQFKDYENKILNFVTNQVPINKVDPTYALYKIGICDGIPQHHVNIVGDIDQMFYITIQADDKYLFLNCLDVQSLFLFLVENNTKSERYVFIPIVFGSEVNEVGHFAMLIFDNVKSEVFFADPNGKTSFFDNILIVHSKKNKTDDWMASYYSDMYINCEEMIEKLMAFYVNDFNTATGMTYKFIPRQVWNRLGHGLNRQLGDSLIGSGHCVITATLIMNYLHTTNADIRAFFDSVGKLTQNELVEIINAYSSGIYQMLL